MSKNASTENSYNLLWSSTLSQKICHNPFMRVINIIPLLMSEMQDWSFYKRICWNFSCEQHSSKQNYTGDSCSLPRYCVAFFGRTTSDSGPSDLGGKSFSPISSDILNFVWFFRSIEICSEVSEEIRILEWSRNCLASLECRMISSDLKKLVW